MSPELSKPAGGASPSTGGKNPDVWGEITEQWRRREFGLLRQQVARLRVPVAELDGVFDADSSQLETLLGRAFELAAGSAPEGPASVALYLYARCLERWEKSAEYRSIERVIEALARAADKLDAGPEEYDAGLLSLAIEHARHLPDAMAVENSLQCSCPVQLGHYAKRVVSRTQPLLGRLNSGSSGSGPAELLRSDVEIASIYFDALRETGEEIEEFLGPPVTGDLRVAAQSLQDAEAAEAIAGDVYQSELRAHLASVRSLDEAAKGPWIQVDQARLTYIYPFALVREGQGSGDPIEDTEEILQRAKGAEEWSLGANRIRPAAAADTLLSDIWQHSDPPERLFEGVTVELPEISVETKERVVEEKYGIDAATFTAQVRLSRLGNHYLRISSELQGADVHELNQALRRGSGSMGEEVLSCAGVAEGWHRFVASENGQGYVEDVIEGVADEVDRRVVGDAGGDVHVVVNLRRASIRDGDGASAYLGEEELRSAIGATLLFHSIGDYAVSLEEWVRYPAAKRVENLLDGAGLIGELLVRTADTTILYMPTSPDWLSEEYAEMIEFVASIPALLTAWDKEVSAHAQELEARLKALKESEVSLDLRDIHRDEAELHELQAKIRRELANLHSPRLVWNRITRDFLDRLWEEAGLHSLEEGLDRQLQVISTQHQRLVAVAGAIAEQNRQDSEDARARLGRVLEFGLTVIAATSLAGLYDWVNSDFSIHDDTLLLLELLFLGGVVIVLGSLIFMSKRSD